MTPYSWKKAQRVGVAFQQQELFYAENATLEHLLEVASAAPTALTLRGLPLRNLQKSLRFSTSKIASQPSSLLKILTTRTTSASFPMRSP
jgi:hypothetical protein